MNRRKRGLNALSSSVGKMLNGVGTFRQRRTSGASPAEALFSLALRDSPFLQTKTPSRVVLRPRRRLGVWCAVDCAKGGPGAMTSPAGILSFLVEGSSIAQSAVGVKGLGQTPLLIADRSSNP